MSTPAAVSTAATTPSGTPGASTLAPEGGIGAAAGPWGMAAEAGLGIGMSLLQASEQASAARNYQEQQNRAIAEAKRQAGANFMQNIGVPVSGELAGMRANTAGYKQAIQAAQEGDVRDLPGIVGRADESMVGANADQSIRMDDKLYALHMAQAQEQKASANALAGIGLEEAQGAGLAKQQAEKTKGLLYNKAVESGLRIGAGLDNMRALYPNQGTSTTQPAYNRATDPMLANINKLNTPQQPMVGPQIDSNPTATSFNMGYGANAETAPSAYNWNLLFK